MAIQLLCPVHQVGRIIGQVGLFTAYFHKRHYSAAHCFAYGTSTVCSAQAWRTLLRMSRTSSCATSEAASDGWCTLRQSQHSIESWSTCDPASSAAARARRVARSSSSSGRTRARALRYRRRSCPCRACRQTRSRGWTCESLPSASLPPGCSPRPWRCSDHQSF